MFDRDRAAAVLGSGVAVSGVAGFDRNALAGPDLDYLALSGAQWTQVLDDPPNCATAVHVEPPTRTDLARRSACRGPLGGGSRAAGELTWP